MRIVITGSTGMLGRALRERLGSAHTLIGVARHVTADPTTARHLACDLSDPASAALISAERPDAIIHAAAMSNVDECERHPDDARRGNADAAATAATAAAQSGAYLVAISTDYVFDGEQGRPYTEEDAPHPMSAYGRSKQEGEARVRRLARRWVILRTSTLYGPGRAAFVDGIAERAARGETIPAFQDQTTSPTYTRDLADAIARLLERLNVTTPSAEPAGVFHVTNQGSCTREEFARYVLSVLGYPTTLIQPVAMRSAALPAPRPRLSAMDNRRWHQEFGWQLRPWPEAVRDYLTWKRQHSTR